MFHMIQAFPCRGSEYLFWKYPFWRHSFEFVLDFCMCVRGGIPVPLFRRLCKFIDLRADGVNFVMFWWKTDCSHAWVLPPNPLPETFILTWSFARGCSVFLWVRSRLLSEPNLKWKHVQEPGKRVPNINSVDTLFLLCVCVALPMHWMPTHTHSFLRLHHLLVY